MKKPLIVYAFIGGGVVVLLLLLLLPKGGEKAADGLQRSASIRQHRLMQGKLIFTGSELVAPLVTEIGQRFHALNPGAILEVKATSSGEGLEQLQAGAAHLAMVARELFGREKKLHTFPLARDGIALVVHPQNPVSRLSAGQVKQIFKGKITNWREVGGRDAAIRVVCVSRRRAIFLQCVNALSLTPHQVKRGDVAETNLDALLRVSQGPAAITFASLGLAARQAEMNGLPIKLLRLGNCPAKSQKVQSGEYPMAYPLFLVSESAPVDMARAFIDFALSKPMQTLVHEHYFAR